LTNTNNQAALLKTSTKARRRDIPLINFQQMFFATQLKEGTTYKFDEAEAEKGDVLNITNICLSSEASTVPKLLILVCTVLRSKGWSRLSCLPTYSTAQPANYQPVLEV
jgi:hypothetical protein